MFKISLAAIAVVASFSFTSQAQVGGAQGQGPSFLRGSFGTIMNEGVNPTQITVLRAGPESQFVIFDGVSSVYTNNAALPASMGITENPGSPFQIVEVISEVREANGTLTIEIALTNNTLELEISAQGEVTVTKRNLAKMTESTKKSILTVSSEPIPREIVAGFENNLRMERVAKIHPFSEGAVKAFAKLDRTARLEIVNAEGGRPAKFEMIKRIVAKIKKIK